MRPEIEQKLSTLPHAPGVYIMKDARGEVFYIGKAKSLRDRVKSYFTGTDTRAFVALLDTMLFDLEVVLTHSDKEALLVEDQLVKRHQPRFNVKLVDDKRFLCLRLDTRNAYPRLDVVRRFAKDGARYFGPYTSASSVREALRLINRHFQLRTCSDQVMANRTRPCLQYQIKRCPAPCVFDIKDAYQENVEDVSEFLSGKEHELVARLNARMKHYATELNFEAAALLRDQIHAIDRSLERQRIVSSDFVNRDVVGLYREGPAVEVHVMRTREGRLIDAQRFSFEGQEAPTAEVLADFASRYYAEAQELPDEIIFPPEMEWNDALAEMLTEKRGRVVHVLRPQRGEKMRLLEMAQKNAHQAYMDKQREHGAAKTAIEKLQRVLHLRNLPEKLECMDISHFGGTNIVASIVRFEQGVPKKELYRHYKLRTLENQDDFQAMYEVMSRRARRGLEESDLPDLFVIDGGKGQLGAAKAALDDHGIDSVDIIGLAKEREGDFDLLQSQPVPEFDQEAFKDNVRRPERVFVVNQKNPIVLRQNSAELFLLTRARDEAHRFAITFQRSQRKRAITQSALDAVVGIGPKRKKLLLKTFGSVTRLKAASLEEISAVIGKKAAARVHAHFHSDAPPPAS